MASGCQGIDSAKRPASLWHELHQRFESAKSTASYNSGVRLFQQGQACRGVFQVLSGKVKLTAAARNGKSAILKVVHSGELLGLSEALLNLPYRSTAEVIEPCLVAFIPRQWLIALMTQSSEVAIRVAEQLSASYLAALSALKELRISITAEQRLAKFLVQFAEQDKAASWQPMTRCTHAEIGQIIGCSRETVTRLLKRFQDRKLVRTNHSTIHISQINEIQRLAQS